MKKQVNMQLEESHKAHFDDIKKELDMNPDEALDVLMRIYEKEKNGHSKLNLINILTGAR